MRFSPKLFALGICDKTIEKLIHLCPLNDLSLSRPNVHYSKMSLNDFSHSVWPALLIALPWITVYNYPLKRSKCCLLQDFPKMCGVKYGKKKKIKYFNMSRLNNILISSGEHTVIKKKCVSILLDYILYIITIL